MNTALISLEEELFNTVEAQMSKAYKSLITSDSVVQNRTTNCWGVNPHNPRIMLQPVSLTKPSVRDQEAKPRALQV